MNDIGKFLIYAGLILVVLGIIIHFGSKILPLFRLPFNFKWESASGNFGVYFPLGSCIIISIILTIILNLLFR